jgi:hypothetical protein
VTTLVVGRHCFDADPDPTFHFDAILMHFEMDPDQQALGARSGSAKMMPMRPDADPEFVTAWQCEIYSAIIVGEKLETNYLPE